MADQTKNEYIIVNPPDDALNAQVVDLKKNPPLVSFCIPTKNNDDTIESCLESIRSQNYSNVEIIIVDGNSTDKTLVIAKKFTDKIYFEGGLLGSARQKSIEMAQGSIVALLDSDIVIPHREWLFNALKFFNYSDDVCTVWPVNVAPPGSSWTTRCYFNLWKVIIEDRIKKQKSYFGGGNSLFKKSCFTTIGGINPNLHWGEDFDWSMKFKNLGYKVIFIHDPLYHNTMCTLKEFYSKQFLGANAFTKTGFQLMGLSNTDILYENFVLGFKGMVHGLVFKRDGSWLYYPIFLLIRTVAYSSMKIANIFRNE